MSKINVITIDGPAGVGKSTVSKKIADILGFILLDTGAMYRAVGIYLGDRAVQLDNAEAVSQALSGVKIDLLSSKIGDCGVVIAGEDISCRIRTPEAAMMASKVSALPVVREKLTEMQRALGQKGAVVAEGRDMGTVVFPQALHKFFLDAAPEVRCKRRSDQLREKGEEVNEVELLEQIITRDKNDRERKIAPLKKAEDALLIDTGTLSLDGVVEAVLASIRN